MIFYVMLSSTDLKVRGYVRYDIDVDLTWLKNNWLKNLIYLKLIKRLYHTPFNNLRLNSYKRVELEGRFNSESMGGKII